MWVVVMVSIHVYTNTTLDFRHFDSEFKNNENCLALLREIFIVSNWDGPKTKTFFIKTPKF
jgi:hypothetical protein